MSEMKIYTGDLFYLKGGGVGACIDDTPTEDGYRFLRVDKACVQPFIVYAWPDFDRLPRPTISLRTGEVTYDPALAEEPLTNRCDNPTMGPITRDACVRVEIREVGE